MSDEDFVNIYALLFKAKPDEQIFGPNFICLVHELLEVFDQAMIVRAAQPSPPSKGDHDGDQPRTPRR